MPEYIVRTTEMIEGRYRVQATHLDEARRKLQHGPPIDWEGVEQLDYMAFDVEVRDIEQVDDATA